MLNRKLFYDHVRMGLFSGHLSRPQVTGIEAILDAWEAGAGGPDPRQLAYVLATAYHETAAAMQPVRETLADSDEEAIRILDAAFRKGQLPRVREPYWRRDADGLSWLGRGLVQLTHKDNYIRMSREIGFDLATDPARAMEMDVAVCILLAGMRKGLFTGRRLDDYFAAGKADWTGARRIVNGLDRAEAIAGYGRSFLTALGH